MDWGMEGSIKGFFFKNFKRKIIALIAAFVIWVLVSSSITTTRVFSRVPVRIVNLPHNKTIHGLMPDGFLDRRLSITLTGTKDVLERMGPNDFEVVIDVSEKGDEWVAKISKNNLVSLNPDIQLLNAISSISHSEMIIHLCRLVSEKIPVFVLSPKGDEPEGYQFLDIWPKNLYHIVSGPEDDVKALQQEGLDLSIDLSHIKKEELDSIRELEIGDDEVSFFIPEDWKRVRIPFLNNAVQTINGVEARQLRIDFLHKDLFPINFELPVRVFYPSETIARINPNTLFLRENSLITKKNGVFFLDKPLFAKSVSRRFLDLVQGHMEIVIVPSLKDGIIQFHTDTQIIDVHYLEEAYVTLTLSNEFDIDVAAVGDVKAFKQYLSQREQYLRDRFREYRRLLQLYSDDKTPFNLHITQDSAGSLNMSEAKD